MNERHALLNVHRIDDGFVVAIVIMVLDEMQTIDANFAMKIDDDRMMD